MAACLITRVGPAKKRIWSSTWVICVVILFPPYYCSETRCPLLENGPNVQAKSTDCCCNRYWYEASVPAATVAGTLGLCPAQHATFGTGSWNEPVSMIQLRRRVEPWPGTECSRSHRHRIVASTGTNFEDISAGSSLDPVPPGAQGKGTGCRWPGVDDPVPMTRHRLPGAMTY